MSFRKDDRILTKITQQLCVYHIASRIITILGKKDINKFQKILSNFLNTNKYKMVGGVSIPTDSPPDMFTSEDNINPKQEQTITIDDLLEYFENNSDPIRKAQVPIIKHAIEELKNIKNLNDNDKINELHGAINPNREVKSSRIYKIVKDGLINLLIMIKNNNLYTRDIALLGILATCIGPSTTAILVFVHYFLSNFLDTCLEASPSWSDIGLIFGFIPLPLPSLMKVKKGSICIIAFMFIYYICITLHESNPGELDTFIGNLAWGILYLIQQTETEESIFGVKIDPNTPVKELGEMITKWLYNTIFEQIVNFIYIFYYGIIRIATKPSSSGFWYGEQWEGSRQIRGSIINIREHLEANNTCFEFPIFDENTIGQNAIMDNRYCLPDAERLGDGSLVFNDYFININNILILGQIKLFLEMLHEQSVSIQFIVTMLKELKRLLYKILTGGTETVKKAAIKVADGLSWFGSKTSDMLSYVKTKSTQWSDNQDFIEEMRLAHQEQAQLLAIEENQIPQIIAAGGSQLIKIKKTKRKSNSIAHYNYKFMYKIVNRLLDTFRNFIFLYISVKQMDTISKSDMTKLDKFFDTMFKIINSMVNKIESLRLLNVKTICDYAVKSAYTEDVKAEIMRPKRKQLLYSMNMFIIVCLLRNHQIINKNNKKLRLLGRVSKKKKLPKSQKKKQGSKSKRSRRKKK